MTILDEARAVLAPIVLGRMHGGIVIDDLDVATIINVATWAVSELVGLEALGMYIPPASAVKEEP